jgi:hypothetical protein
LHRDGVARLQLGILSPGKQHQQPEGSRRQDDGTTAGSADYACGRPSPRPGSTPTRSRSTSSARNYDCAC